MKLTLEDLFQAIHTALRSWLSGSLQKEPWSDMLVVRLQTAEQPTPNLELATKKVLLDALDALEKEEGSVAGKILRLRFLDGLTAQATANRLNLTENVVYKQQRTAIEEMAAIIGRAEDDARSARAARILRRLEIPQPPRLFGLGDKLEELLAILTAPGPPWLSAVVGIGGIGKTSLADAAVRALAAEPALADIAWLSARQDRFTLWDGLQASPEGTPALTMERLVEGIVEQFGFRDLAQLPPAQKQDGLRARLKAQPYLVVVDNLETAADYRALIPDLQGMVHPTRFLLTSRHSLHEYPGVHNLRLDELLADDSLALLRHEAGERGLAEVADAPRQTLWPIYEAAGGNPLALKLLVGQMHTLSLPRVVADLRQARGRTVEELYHFIYWRSWNLLGDAARRVLAIMPLVAESGGGLAQIVALSTLDEEAATSALQQLAGLSLVNVGGTIESRRYSIHRLTETFLLNEVIKWQSPS
ncbi:MAG: NB-ARC domain-containing protein [Anaerolineae bacterium]